MTTVTIKNVQTNASVEINVEDVKLAAKQLREAGHSITAATINRILETEKSSAGWTIIKDGKQFPWSERDVKKFKITEEVQPTFENLSHIVAEQAPEVVTEAVAEVAEQIIEAEYSNDPDDLTADNVKWLKRNAKGPQELGKVRKNSKVWEIIVLLKKERLTLKQIQEKLYEVGLDEDQIDDYKVTQAFYDVMWKGYNIAKIAVEGGEPVYAIRHLDFTKVTDILVY
ncbi:hypothetical protein SHAb15599_00009 [Acinetobacter phage SH-Ab 15599]|nr:hypothetical protein SHAb15599_00009 [Acinetobacter phage SH-Ab 15599]